MQAEAEREEEKIANKLMQRISSLLVSHIFNKISLNALLIEKRKKESFSLKLNKRKSI